MIKLPRVGAKGNRREVLRALVGDRIKNAPFERDGYTWAAEPQSWYCDQLGVSSATLRRLIGCPPFSRDWAHVDGRKVTLLRVGKAGKKPPREFANIMSAIWQKRIGRRTTPTEFGCICGLVGAGRDGSPAAWPPEQGPDMLSMVIDEWQTFMAGVKIEMPEPKYLRYPSLKVIRLYAPVALEMVLMREQAKLTKQLSAAE